MSIQPVGLVSPVGRAAQWARGLLLTTLVLTAASVVSGLFQIDLLSHAASGGISDAAATANDTRQVVIGGLQGIFYLATAVAFLNWIYRAYRNLTSLGVQDRKYSPGWAVGWFFVPVLSLVRPFQLMLELWHGSDPSGLERDAAPAGPSIQSRPGTPPLVGWWWAVFLVSCVLGRIVLQMSLAQHPTLDQLQTLSVLLVLSDAVDVAAALLAIGVIGRITSWQAERAERVRQITDEHTLGPLAHSPLNIPTLVRRPEQS